MTPAIFRARSFAINKIEHLRTGLNFLIMSKRVCIIIASNILKFHEIGSKLHLNLAE